MDCTVVILSIHNCQPVYRLIIKEKSKLCNILRDKGKKSVDFVTYKV